jgi:hypothetical protein
VSSTVSQDEHLLNAAAGGAAASVYVGSSYSSSGGMSACSSWRRVREDGARSEWLSYAGSGIGGRCMGADCGRWGPEGARESAEDEAIESRVRRSGAWPCEETEYA